VALDASESRRHEATHPPGLRPAERRKCQSRISLLSLPNSREFTAYIVENSLVSTALYESGVAQQNGVIASQSQARAESFTVPF
jgi:hypothetical protein